MAPDKPYYNEFFRLMGIKQEQIINVKKPTQFRSVTVPDQSQEIFCYFTKEALMPYDAIKAHVMPSTKKKLYLTRTAYDRDPRRAERMHCFNEKYFEDFFVAHGFEAISMEKLPIEEQISLIMGADEIASTMGTLAHLAIFCKPTARFIMLNRTKSYVSARQCQIMEAIGLKNYYIVDGSHNFMYANHPTGACMLGVNKYWKQFVADYFGEQIKEEEAYQYLGEAIDEYVDFWCKRYFDPKSTYLAEKPRAINSLKDLCRHTIALEETLTRGRPALTYQTHVHVIGWSSWIEENRVSNDLNRRLDIQAIKINFPSHKVYYSVYCNEEEGWLEATAPEMAGHIGGHKPIHGMKVWLDEAGAKKFDILYRMHKFDGTWTPWAKNGEELYSLEQKLNAIQIIKTRQTC